MTANTVSSIPEIGTAPELYEWVNNADPNARVTYHVGFLALDRDESFNEDDADIARLKDLQDAVKRLIELGLITSTQTRIGTRDRGIFKGFGLFEYRAHRTRGQA
jgi:hypothetical protein